MAGMEASSITSEQADTRNRSSLQYHLGSYFSSSDAVESPTTLTGLKCTIQPGCQTPAAWNSARTVGSIPQGPGGKR